MTDWNAGGVPEHPPLLIPVGLFHHVWVDHDSRTMQVRATGTAEDVLRLTPGELQDALEEAERVHRRLGETRLHL